MKKLVLLSLFAGACFAQSPFIIGVRGGVPLNDAINNVESDTKVSGDHYVVGPTIGVRLPWGFSITGDALFSSTDVKAPYGRLKTVSQVFSSSARSWEFPVMARLAIGHGPLKPFVGAGASVRHISDFNNVPDFFSGNGSLEKRVGVGFVVGGGVDLGLGPVHITPELRYTHYGSDDVSAAWSSVVKFNQNEGKILVGITF